MRGNGEGIFFFVLKRGMEILEVFWGGGPEGGGIHYEIFSLLLLFSS